MDSIDLMEYWLKSSDNDYDIMKVMYENKKIIKRVLIKNVQMNIRKHKLKI